MTLLIRLDHYTVLAEMRMSDLVVAADENDVSIEFHTYVPSSPAVVVIMMNRKEALTLITTLTRPDHPNPKHPDPPYTSRAFGPQPKPAAPPKPPQKPPTAPPEKPGADDEGDFDNGQTKDGNGKKPENR